MGAASHLNAASSDTPTAPPAALSLRSGALIVLYGAGLLAIGLGGLVMTYHEVNYSEPAREMLRGAGWLMTRFGGEPFVEKPPLINWSIAGAMALFGSQNEWVTRIPSVISAIASALIIAAMAARWFGDRIGLYSGLVELTCMYVQAQGRRAEPDMMLCALVSAALALFALGNIDAEGARPSRRPMPRLFYAAAGASFLVKGPIGPAFVLLPCAVFAARGRNSRRFLLDPIGLCILLLIVMAWPAALYLSYPAGLGSLWQEHWLRISGAWGTQPWLFYLYIPALLMLPWTPLVLSGAAAVVIEHRARAPIWRLLGWWLVAGTVILSISPFKHWHYIIPVLPPLSIAGAVGLDRFLHAANPRYGLRLLSIGAGLLAIPAVYIFLRPQAGTISALVLAAAGGASIALYLQWRSTPQSAAAALFATVWVVSVAVQLAVTPHFQTYSGQTQLARKANREIPAGAPLYLLGPPHNQMVFYLTMPIVSAEDISTLEHRLESARDRSPVYILGPQSAKIALSRFGDVQTLDRCDSLRKGESERDRLTLMRLTLNSPPLRLVPPPKR